MPLRHRDAAFIPEPTGCYFVLTDTVGEDVLCVVEPEALVTAAKECGIDDQEMQSVFRELRSAIEACASDLYDAAGLGPEGRACSSSRSAGELSGPGSA
jgi:hypothetical protein